VLAAAMLKCLQAGKVNDDDKDGKQYPGHQRQNDKWQATING